MFFQLWFLLLGIANCTKQCHHRPSACKNVKFEQSSRSGIIHPGGLLGKNQLERLRNLATTDPDLVDKLKSQTPIDFNPTSQKHLYMVLLKSSNFNSMNIYIVLGTSDVDSINPKQSFETTCFVSSIKTAN